MSPSGSRMQTAGTSTVGIPFCRRASRSSAAGRNTDGEDGFLLSNKGACSTGPLKQSAIVVGRDLNLVAEFEAARLDTNDGLFWRHPQMRRWPSRLS